MRDVVDRLMVMGYPVSLSVVVLCVLLPEYLKVSGLGRCVLHCCVMAR
jgi:hypothetical protein